MVKDIFRFGMLDQMDVGHLKTFALVRIVLKKKYAPLLAKSTHKR